MNDKLDLLPAIPENMPYTDKPILRWFGRSLLKMWGWRIVGELPNEKKVIVAAAPHTSNWDFLLAMATVMALGVKVSYLMKKEAFFWPFKNFFMSLGGIPLDRKAADGTVNQIAKWYEKNDKVWVAITPEGTRSKVERWKTGFLRVAHQANVPILIVAWDYPTKTMTLDKCWTASGDHSDDAEAIRHYVTNKFTGKHPEKQ